MTTSGLLAGVDIGGTKTAVVLSSRLPEISAKAVFPTNPAAGPEPAIENIIHSLRGCLRSIAAAPGALRAVGVSCGGPLDAAAGVIQQPPNLPTWNDVAITSILRAEFGVPCLLENDANAGALAEHAYGAGKGVDDLVFLTMGTGLGAGLILNGRLYRGACDAAGELGHVRLTPDGPVGHNKAGSVEGWASGGGMANLARMRLAEARAGGADSLLAHMTDNLNELTAAHIRDAAMQGDMLAQQIVRTCGEKRRGDGHPHRRAEPRTYRGWRARASLWRRVARPGSRGGTARSAERVSKCLPYRAGCTR